MICQYSMHVEMTSDKLHAHGSCQPLFISSQPEVFPLSTSMTVIKPEINGTSENTEQSLPNKYQSHSLLRCIMLLIPWLYVCVVSTSTHVSLTNTRYQYTQLTFSLFIIPSCCVGNVYCTQRVSTLHDFI